VFAARTATEIGAGNQHIDAGVLRPVQDEVSSRPAMFVEAQVMQETEIQACLVDAAKELLGHDLIGVEVGNAQRRGSALNKGVIRHGCSPDCGHR
jgi:hypothetical protein